jgi:hypothetical protein
MVVGNYGLAKNKMNAAVNHGKPVQRYNQTWAQVAT